MILIILSSSLGPGPNVPSMGAVAGVAVSSCVASLGCPRLSCRVARRGVAWRDVTDLGRAWLGVSWRGAARLGVACTDAYVRVIVLAGSEGVASRILAVPLCPVQLQVQVQVLSPHSV